jgi:hypothetical protein
LGSTGCDAPNAAVVYGLTADSRYALNQASTCPWVSLESADMIASMVRVLVRSAAAAAAAARGAGRAVERVDVAGDRV